MAAGRGHGPRDGIVGRENDSEFQIHNSDRTETQLLTCVPDKCGG